jgi:exopolyphosphatase/guanosine-5'-triphosphate,3'-diphosphate pyrophosphatase
MSSTQRVASFDIGSNTVLMLVAERRDGRWHRVADEMAITRISEGLDSSGVLAPHAVARTLAALGPMAQRAREEHGCDLIVATGTAPFRRSTNGAAVAQLVSDTIGAALRVVTGDEEADLVLGASRIAFPEFEQLVVIDIGGASTEVVVAGDTITRVSLDVGSVRLTERYATAGEYDRPAHDRLSAGIAAAIAVPQASGVVAAGSGLPLVGVAGTVTTLACVHLGLAEWDDDAVHGLVMSRAEVVRLAELLPALSVAERCALPGMPAARADVIAAGACLLWALMVALNAEQLIVSDRGIRWGRLAWIHA